jgi:GNAT superfamily N-acetyltransferase
MEAARRALVADRADVVRLARQARAEAREKRGGPLFVDDGLRGEPLEELVPEVPSPDRLVLVGTIDDVIVGYAILHVRPLRTGECLGVVEELYVDPEARGVSVGETMMDQLVEFATEQGCIGLDSFALPGDRQTKNFFETFGLVARGIVVHRSLRLTPEPGRPAVLPDDAVLPADVPVDVPDPAEPFA